MLQDPFAPNRWIYLYTLDVPDFFNQKLKVVLDFEDDLLTTITGDFAPIPEDSQATEAETTAAVTEEVDAT